MTSLSHTWGIQPHEREQNFPCDRLIPVPDDTCYRGITIKSSPHIIFLWLCQMQVAPYSYDWIDHYGRQSPRQLTPGLDNLVVGQNFMEMFELVDFVQDQHLTLRTQRKHKSERVFGDVAVSYWIQAENEPSCRLLVKLTMCYPRGIMGWVMRRALPLGDFIMMRRQLMNFKALAEKTMAEA